MNYVVHAFAALCAYLLGSIPNGIIVSRLKGIDIRTVGSGNIGATNVFRSVSKPLGLLTFALDFLKGWAPAWVFPRLITAYGGCAAGTGAAILFGVAAVIGHNWTVFAGFKGGKGVATSAGVLLGIAPPAFLLGLVAWVIFFLSTRYVSVASMSAALVLGGFGWLKYRREGLLLPVTLTVLAALVIWRHRSNIQRLYQGKEHRFEFSRKKKSEVRRQKSEGGVK